MSQRTCCVIRLLNFCLLLSLVISMSQASRGGEGNGSKDGGVGAVLAFFKDNVVDRKMVATHWVPKNKDPQSGQAYQTTFTRTSWYFDARKTDFGMSVEYRVVIDWKTFNLDDTGKPEGDPYDVESRDTIHEIALNAYPGHARLVGIFRKVEGTTDKKPHDVGPSDCRRVSVYVSTDDAGRSVLRIDAAKLYPHVPKIGPSKTEEFRTNEWFGTLWLEDGKLHQRRLWRTYYVDPQTLARSRPTREEQEVYEDSE